MKTLEELKAEMAKIQEQIKQAEAQYFYIGAYGVSKMSMPENDIDSSMFFDCEEWSREEVERIALACKLLRKSYIRAKEEGIVVNEWPDNDGSGK